MSPFIISPVEPVRNRPKPVAPSVVSRSGSNTFPLNQSNVLSGNPGFGDHGSTWVDPRNMGTDRYQASGRWPAAFCRFPDCTCIAVKGGGPKCIPIPLELTMQTASVNSISENMYYRLVKLNLTKSIQANDDRNRPNLKSRLYYNRILWEPHAHMALVTYDSKKRSIFSLAACRLLDRRPPATRPPAPHVYAYI